MLFLTIAVPLYFEPSNTVILWSAESALVYFFGLRQQRPHIRLGALIVYLLAALIQLGNYQGFGTDTVLEGQWFTTVVVLLGGAAIYLLWYFSRREGSAQWEKSVQTAVLSTALLYISILPLLFLADQGSIVALSALAAAWAFCRRKHEPNVFITFALGNVLFALLLQAGIIYESQGFLSHLYLIAATPLLFAAAYALQYPRVPLQPKSRKETRFTLRRFQAGSSCLLRWRQAATPFICNGQARKPCLSSCGCGRYLPACCCLQNV